MTGVTFYGITAAKNQENKILKKLRKEKGVRKYLDFHNQVIFFPLNGVALYKCPVIIPHMVET